MDNRFLRQQNLINGQWVGADSGETIAVDNPATEDVIGYIPNSGAAETRRAIEAAKQAFANWSRTTALHRADILLALHDAIMDNQRALAELLTTEQGKPLAESMGEVGMSAGYVRWFAEQGRRVYGETIASPWADRRMQVIKQPVGVVAAITPWNFPSSMLARKIAPALAVGCTIVVKPAVQTPYSGLAWGVLAEQVGIPAGVINILTGNAKQIGTEICSHTDVAKITFTGSTPVGKQLLKQAADTVKKVSMELGGNAPFIVFDDADIDRAVAGAVAAKFRNSGQTCVCTNRFYVQRGVYDEFLQKFIVATNALKVGNGFDEAVQQGPLIDERALESTQAMIADACEKGGRIVAGGSSHALGGRFFSPTVIAEANSTMRVYREEIFSPIAPVFVFDDEKEVITEANNTEFGLACYFYTQDLGRTYRMMEALEYGLVGVNEGIITALEAPFGGWKQSGIGKEGGYQGLEDYLDSKYICLGGLGL